MEPSKQLINLITTQTQELKTIYIDRTREWANSFYYTQVDRASWKEEQWADFLGVEKGLANEGMPSQFITFHKGFYNSKESKRYKSLRNQALTTRYIGLDKTVNKAIKSAENHYEHSVAKLAYRVIDKNLDISNMTLVCGKIGINLELILSDNVKSIKAWTVWAEGEINKPHFRYLIK